MMDAAVVPRLVWAKLRHIRPMLQDGKIDVAVAKPNAVVAGLFRLAEQLLQVEVFLVELSGTRRILAHDRNVPDKSHGLFSFSFATLEPNATSAIVFGKSNQTRKVCNLIGQCSAAA